MNRKNIVGTVTIIGVLGLTAYSIYLWRKQKKIDEETISLDEAIDLIKERGSREKYHTINPETESEVYNSRYFKEYENTDKSPSPEDVDDKLEIIGEFEVVDKDDTLSVGATMTPEEIDASIKEGYLREVDPDAIWHEDEGAGKLRHDPNSDDALIQFHNMELAEWRPSDFTFQAMVSLFDIPFNPYSEGDEHLYDKLVDHRVEFFGRDSKWNDRISFADVVLYFARKSAYNLDEPYKYWVEHFISTHGFIDINEDDLGEVVDEFNKHEYFNDKWGRYGLFLLTSEEMDDILNRVSPILNRVSPSDAAIPSFEDEFNMFLKQSK